jgi:histidine triad (HIT) family protein
MGIRMKEDCIFCKIATGDIPSKTLYQDDKFRIILDIGAANRGHALIIPKEHYSDLWDMPEEFVAESMKLARTMTARIKETLNCDGFNLVQNNGYAAGQTVFHYHLHLIPRYEGDERMVSWKPGTPDDSELEEIKKLITGQ